MRAIVGVSGGVDGSKEGLSTKEICPSHGPSNFSSSVLHILSRSRLWLRSPCTQNQKESTLKGAKTVFEKKGTISTNDSA